MNITGAIGGPYGDAEISDGEIHGSEITFTVPGIVNGVKSDQHYEGTVDGNTIHLTVTFGNANVQARLKVDATRAQ